MNTNDLTTAWKMYSSRLEATQQISEKIIVSMIRERSTTRLEKIRLETIALMLFLSLLLILFVAVLAGNPFDYRYSVQYVPVGLYMVLTAGGLVRLFKDYRMMDVQLTANNLESFLEKSAARYKKSLTFSGWKIAGLMLLASMLFSLSFLPNKLDKTELWPALGDTAISWVVSVVLYVAAWRLGAFKDRHGIKFSTDLAELQESKTMSDELKGQ